MHQVIFSIPDEVYAPFMRIVKALPFSIKTKNITASTPKKITPEQQEWVDGLRRSLHEVELHGQGKIELRSAYDLLDEL